MTEGMIHVIFGQRGAKNDWENMNKNKLVEKWMAATIFPRPHFR